MHPRHPKDTMAMQMIPLPRRRLSAQHLALACAAVLGVGALTSTSALAAPPAPGIDIKITTFNTEYWHIPEQELIDQVHYQDMDLVFFQEHLEKRGNTWGPTNRIPQLKAVLKDRHVAVNGEVVTLSRWPIVHTHAFSKGEAIRTDLKGPDGRVISTYNIHLPVHLHLELVSRPLAFYQDAQATAARRQELLEEVIADLSGNQNPVIVAGDFNTSSAMNGTAWFREHMTDAYVAPRCPQARDTFEIAGVLTWRIDYVFVSRHFVPASYCTQAAPKMSDHKAVIAELRLLDQPAPSYSTSKAAP